MIHEDASANNREVIIIILCCTIFTLILRYRSEISLIKNYQYQDQELQRNTQKRIQLPSSLSSPSNSEFVNPFLHYDHSSLNSNAYGAAPIPTNIDELIRDQMPPIPAAYANLADLNQDFTQLNDKQQQVVVPFLWHVPRTGVATLAEAFGKCLDLTIATSASSVSLSSRSMNSFQNIFFDQNQQSAVVLRHGEGKYVNVNLDTEDGILRANELQILQQQKNEGSDDTGQRVLVDVVITTLVYATSKILFAPQYASNPKLPPKGQLFTMLRHPVEREISYFYYLKDHGGYGEFSNNSISGWLTSSTFVDNFMVRSLINNFDQSYIVTVQDLLVSKEVLRRKCLVGLLEEKGSSWRRMKKYFGATWDHRLEQYHNSGVDDSSRDECEQKLLFWGWCNRNPHRPHVNHGVDGDSSGGIETGSSTDAVNDVDRALYEKIKLVNRWDMILYEYAKYLFWQQGDWL